MNDYSLLVYAHILLMVFWLGADVGVFIAGLHFMNPRLSIEQRRAVIAVALVIDRYPRICVPATLPIGVQLASLRGILPLGSSALLGTWAVSVIWLSAVVVGMVRYGKPIAFICQRLERVIQLAALVMSGGGGVWMLLARGRCPPWLAGKMIAFGSICLFILLLERAFPPVMAAFSTICAEGSRPELEARLTRGMYRSYAWVGSIYVGVLVAGFLGTVKP